MGVYCDVDREDDDDCDGVKSMMTKMITDERWKMTMVQLRTMMMNEEAADDDRWKRSVRAWEEGLRGLMVVREGDEEDDGVEAVVVCMEVRG